MFERFLPVIWQRASVGQEVHMVYPSPKPVVPVQMASSGSRDGGLKTLTVKIGRAHV